MTRTSHKRSGSLRGKVRTPEETLLAIRPGEIDPFVVSKGEARQVSTIEGADYPYQALVENIREGALTLSRTGIILHTNTQFAEMVLLSPDKVRGTSIIDHVCPEYRTKTGEALSGIAKKAGRINVRIRQGTGSIPVHLSMNLLPSSEEIKICVVVTDRRKDEEIIRMQARMLNAVGDAIIAVDTDHTIIFWNEAATKTYGWRSEEVIGRHTIDVTVPELSKNNALEILAQLEKGEMWSGEYLVRHRDGHEFFVHVTDSPIFDDEGNLIAIIGASHDISDQKRAEDALRQNQETLLRAQELLETVTKATDVIIAVLDVNFCYTFFNQAYKEEMKHLTGRDLTLSTSMVELFAGVPEEQERAVEEWSKVLNGETVNHMIGFGEPEKHHKVYHVLHTPIRDAQGSIVGVGEVAYDVTKQVQVEDTLRETKEYLDNLITYANAPIIVWDPQFRITLFNQAFEHLTNRKAQEVIGKKLDILIPDQCLTVAMDLIRRTMEGERWESVEIPILQKKGGVRTVLWNSASIFGPDGSTIVSTIAQGQDITERKKIEFDYRQRAAEFAKMNVALEEEIQQRTISDTTLKKTLSLLNASLESTTDGILVVDPQGKITSYNQNFVNMWNIPPVLLAAGENERVMTSCPAANQEFRRIFSQYQRAPVPPGTRKLRHDRI